MLNARYGLNLLVYTGAFSADELGLIRKAADMGFDGVEILFADLGALDAQATRAALEASNMGMTACCVMTEDANPCSQDAGVRKAAVDRLKEMIDLTAEMGGEAIAGPLYSPVRHLTGRARTDDEWKYCTDVLAAGAEHADKMDIQMAIEPLNRFETYVINTVADAVRMCREVGSDHLKVQIDTFHANIEEKDTAAAIRQAGTYLGHFHASENDRGVPGTGQVRWDEAFAALSDIDYSGWITIESFATGIVDLCAAACIWRPIYETADGLAQDGLAFLKRTAGAV